MERAINEQRDKLSESQKCEAHSSSRWAHLAAQFAGLQRALGVEHDDADEVGSRRRYGDGSHRLLVDADGVTGVCIGMRLRPCTATKREEIAAKRVVEHLELWLQRLGDKYASDMQELLERRVSAHRSEKARAAALQRDVAWFRYRAGETLKPALAGKRTEYVSC